MAIISSIPGVSKGGFRVTLAGRDITAFVDESSIDVEDSLGQGPGTSSGSSGRAATCKFTTTLGPLATSIGAGTYTATPQLVRAGELLIYDANNAIVFGGYAVKYTDKTEKTTVYTEVEAHDYYQALARTVVNETFSGQTDTQIIAFLLNKYAPWVNTKLLPTTSGYQFPIKNFRNVTLMDALNQITDVTGYMSWIDANKFYRYVQPLQAQTSTFGLSDRPNFRTTFQCSVSDYEIDDTSLINRVYFYGGRRPSGDFTQDLSPQANGNNKTFVLAYYPRNAGDGHIHVKVNNGADLVLGFLDAQGAPNTLKSAGGKADVLLNADGHTLNFDVAPAAGATVTCRYRYELPLIVVIADETSHRYFGAYYDGTISDETVFDTQQAVQRCRILLAEQSFGLTTLKINCWKAGIKSGQIIKVDHFIRGIHASYIVQQVHITSLGNGQFQYELECGAWRWNVVDVIKSAAFASTTSDTSTQETSTPVQIQQAPVTVRVAHVITKTLISPGPKYARAVPLNDGHDAYPGFTTLQ